MEKNTEWKRRNCVHNWCGQTQVVNFEFLFYGSFVGCCVESNVTSATTATTTKREKSKNWKKRWQGKREIDWVPLSTLHLFLVSLPLRLCHPLARLHSLHPPIPPLYLNFCRFSFLVPHKSCNAFKREGFFSICTLCLSAIGRTTLKCAVFIFSRLPSLSTAESWSKLSLYSTAFDQKNW